MCTSSEGMWRFALASLSVKLQNKALGGSKKNPSMRYFAFQNRQKRHTASVPIAFFFFFFHLKKVSDFVFTENN